LDHPSSDASPCFAFLRHCGLRRRLMRFGDYTLSLSPREPFDAELLMPFQLDEQPETVVVA